MTWSSTLSGTPVASRTPLDVVEAYSGAWLERVELADGRVAVVKHLPEEGDWLTRVTDGLGRTRALWHSGLLGRLEPAVEHGILDVTRHRDLGTGDHGIGDHDIVVMEDLAARLWPHSSKLDRRTVRGAMAALAALHDVGERVVARGVGEIRLCSIGARYGVFAPAFHSGDQGPNPHRFRDGILDGWEMFAEYMDSDVVGPSPRCTPTPTRSFAGSTPLARRRRSCTAMPDQRTSASRVDDSPPSTGASSPGSVRVRSTWRGSR